MPPTDYRYPFLAPDDVTARAPGLALAGAAVGIAARASRSRRRRSHRLRRLRRAGRRAAEHGGLPARPLRRPAVAGPRLRSRGAVLKARRRAARARARLPRHHRARRPCARGGRRRRRGHLLRDALARRAARGLRRTSRCSSRPASRSAAISAIAAATGVVEADEDEVAFSVALVTLCGTLAIVILPLLHGPLGLDDGGSTGPGSAQACTTSRRSWRPRRPTGSVALATAIVVKLTRVLLLAPLVMLLALVRRRAVPAGGQRPQPAPAVRGAVRRRDRDRQPRLSSRRRGCGTSPTSALCCWGWRCSRSALASTSHGCGGSGAPAARARTHVLGADRGGLVRGRPRSPGAEPAQTARTV